MQSTNQTGTFNKCIPMISKHLGAQARTAVIGTIQMEGLGGD